ncbi:MAG: efflux RND transporter periplasmic adaptor subunit [Pseudomonadota bacterium]
MSMTLRIAVAALAMALTAGGAVAQRGPAAVVVAPVENSEIADTSPVIAQLVGTVDAQVAVRAAGIVSEVRFRVGDRVAVGDELVRLDGQIAEIQQDNATAALAAARASVEVAEARARQTAQALERQAGLRNSTAFSRGQFEDLEQQASEARSEIARAQAEVGVAEAALARAEYDLRHTLIRAPFAGVVIERMAQPGQYIALGDAVARLLDVDRLEIEAEVPVDLVAGLSPGREVDAIFDGGHQARAAVRTLLPVETVSTRTRTVRFAVVAETFPEALAAVGRSVTLRLPVSAPRSAPVIPKDALVQGGGGWIVYVADSGKAEPRGVGLGQPNGDRIEVLSGVTVGEHVVIRGNERLRPGQPIAPRLADGSPLSEKAEPPAEQAPAREAPAASAPAAEGGDRAVSERDSAAPRSDTAGSNLARAPVVPSGAAAAAEAPAATGATDE